VYDSVFVNLVERFQYLERKVSNNFWRQHCFTKRFPLQIPGEVAILVVRKNKFDPVAFTLVSVGVTFFVDVNQADKSSCFLQLQKNTDLPQDEMGQTIGRLGTRFHCLYGNRRISCLIHCVFHDAIAAFADD
jgi:hypothetical protein